MIRAGAQVYLAMGNTDMRKAIDGLAILVDRQLSLQPFSGHLFVFCNRRRTMVKILYWDRNGFCLWQKRLERDRFRWPETADAGGVIEIEERELRWLLDGMELTQRLAHGRLDYSRIF